MNAGQDVLDYVVSYDRYHESIKVIQIDSISDSTQWKEKYHKSISNPLGFSFTGYLHIDQFTSQPDSQQIEGIQYDAFVAAKYNIKNEDEDPQYSFFYAKFSTLYNITESFYYSHLYIHQEGVNEEPVGIKTNPIAEQTYVAIKVNVNSYYGSTVYEPGAEETPISQNIAIVSFDYNYGNRKWVQLLGTNEYDEEFVSITQYGNSLFVLLNSRDPNISASEENTQDLLLYWLHPDTGYIKHKQFIGSSTHDVGRDMKLTNRGLYILAELGKDVVPHRINSRYWNLPGSQNNLALIFLKFEDEASDNGIIDIEAYDASPGVVSNPILPRPLPKQLIIPMISNEIFFAANRQDDHTSGIFFTKIADSSLMFSSTSSCTSGCVLCAEEQSSFCFRCENDLKLYFQGQCFTDNDDGDDTNDCPDFSFKDPALKVCKECHHSCKSCSKPNKNSCDSCCTTSQCDLRQRKLEGSQCICDPGVSNDPLQPAKVESNGLCVDNCNSGFRGLESNICHLQCPSTSYQMIDLANISIRSHYYSQGASFDCKDTDTHLKFMRSLNSNGIIELPVAIDEQNNTFPQQATFSLWVYLDSSSTDGTIAEFLQKFGINFSSTELIISIEGSNITELTQTGFSKSKWQYISLSQMYDNQSGELIVTMVNALKNQNDNLVNDKTYRNTQGPYLDQTVGSIILGGSQATQSNTFGGLIKEVKYFKAYHSITQQKQDRDRYYAGNSYDDSAMISYWKFDDINTIGQQQFQLKDSSQNKLILDLTRISQGGQVISPVIEQNVGKKLNLCYYHDVAKCHSVDKSKMPGALTSVEKLLDNSIFSFSSDESFTFNSGDKIHFYQGNCGYGSILAIMKYSGGVWVDDDSNDSKSILDLKDGVHYQLCYQKEDYEINIGQVYIQKSIDYIYPFNAGTSKTPTAIQQFSVSGQDIAVGDKIKLLHDCTQDNGTVEQEITRQQGGKYQEMAISEYPAGEYQICWQPKLTQMTGNGYYQSLNGATWLVSEVPTATAQFDQSQQLLNKRFITPKQIQGTLVDGDRLAWAVGNDINDACIASNLRGAHYTKNNGYLPPFWFGSNTFTHGMSSSETTLHLCWKSSAFKSQVFWNPVKFGQELYKVNINVSGSDEFLPELQSINPKYGGSINPQDRISFVFSGTSTLYPQPGNSQLEIKAVTLKRDGSIDYSQTSTLWFKDFPNAQQGSDLSLKLGDVECDIDGACVIKIHDLNNKLKLGSGYILTFKEGSFAKTSPMKLLFDGGENYDHLFFCRSWDLYGDDNNDKVLGSNPTKLRISGTNLKRYSHQLRDELPNPNNNNNIEEINIPGAMQIEGFGGRQSVDFETKSMNITFSIQDNIQCTIKPPPIGTVHAQKIVQEEGSSESYIDIEDFNLNGCEFGTLFATVKIVRGIFDGMEWTHLHTTSYEDLRLGTIGCHENCITCFGGGPEECIVCKDTENVFTDRGRCVKECPQEDAPNWPKNPYWETKKVVYKYNRYYPRICTNKTPDAFFSHPVTGLITPCNDDCMNCETNSIANCLICKPLKFLFVRDQIKQTGVCIPQTECDQAEGYISNYENYQCIKDPNEAAKECNSDGNPLLLDQSLQIRISDLGYEREQPKDIQIFLRADINNKRGELLEENIVWTLIEPELDLINDPEGKNKKKNMFKEDLTAANPPVFLNIGATIKVKMSAFNYVPPSQRYKFKVTATNSCGDIATDFYEYYLNDPPRAKEFVMTPNTDIVMHETQLTLQATGGWYDSVTDTSQQLEFKVAIENLQDGSVYLAQSLQKGEDINLYLPILSKSQAPLKLKVYLYAQDKHQVQAFKTQEMTINNPFDGSEESRLNILQEMNNRYVATVSENNPEGVLQNSSDVLTILTSLEFLGEKPRKAPHGEGVCNSNFHCFNHGICNMEVTGYGQCQCYKGYSGIDCQYSHIQLTQLDSLFSKVLKSIKNKYQALNPLNYVNNDIEYITYAIRGLFKHPDLIKEEDEEFLFTLISNCSMASKQSLWSLRKPQWKAFVDAVTTMLQQVHYKAKMNYINTEHQKHYEGNSENQEKEFRESLKQRMNTLFRAMLQVFRVVATKLDDITTKFEYQTDAIDIRLKRVKMSEITLPYTYKIREWEDDLEVILPSDIFDGITNLYTPSSNQADVELKFMGIKWKVNPFLHHESAHLVETPPFTFEMLNSNGDKFEIKDRITPIQIKLPYQKKKNFPQELLKCKVWGEVNQIEMNELEYDFIEDQCMLKFIPRSIQNPRPLAMMQTTHLSTFVGVFDKTDPHPGHNPPKGIYTNFFAMQYWTESFGFIAVLGCAGVYLIGLIFFIIIDRRPTKRLISRLEQEFQGIEKYKENQEEIQEETKGEPRKQKKKKKEFDNEDEVSEVQMSKISNKKGSKRKKTRNIVIPFDDEKANPPTGKSIDQNLTTTNLETSHIEDKPLQKKMEVDDSASEVEGKKKQIKKKVKDIKEESKEEKFDNMNEEKKYEPSFDLLAQISKKRELTEQKKIQFKQMLIHGNAFLNLMCVTSLLFPRHARWTLAYCNFVLIWFICGVFYNNTKDPLEIPDFSKEAKMAAIEDLWISFISPFAVWLMMYVFSGLYRMTDQRLRNSTSLPMLKEMLIELRKEMLLRFIMAYFILLAVYASVFWYVIRFTSTFGWKVSWAWWWSGCISAFCNFFLYDFFLTLIHFIIYKCNRTAGILIQKARSVKQGWSEA